MKRTKRIFYGPDENPTAFWWDVQTDPATKSVKINGTLEHAISGVAGSSIGCRLSNAAVDKQNSSAFPHPVIVAAFYKSIALIVDKLAKNGTPCHAFEYEHEYGNFIDLNDLHNLEPVYKDRSFHLRPPRNRHNNKSTTPNALLPDGNPSLKTVRAAGLLPLTKPVENLAPSSAPKRAAKFVGAIGRAKKAGLIGNSAANQLARAVKRIDR